MNFLFLCTGNSCRSILSEALFNAACPPTWHADSAGSHPTGRVHAQTLAALQATGIDIAGLHSKAIADIHTPVDVVITVCADADAACPAFPGSVLRAHWGLSDPSIGLPIDQVSTHPTAFCLTIARIQLRLQHLFAADFEHLSRDEQQACLDGIGRL
ncbi:low molecular weight phosphatase family protein [Vitreoscilla massiliensis]|uniref:Low molecular weight phosphatase family protein n=1 Tax=Vitreoscilla massiliensis TaxID=1689272 RepID=A0ABY4DZY8_9NEIS|nr:low molecular weight phosphatase family protein [Vitreoscilla massiliensis]UOO88564.1 low molecular weight phosphatase family protein [Vitreoscilla massiliensis]